MRSLGHILDENKGIGPGFDFLRLWLAMSVLWFHSFVVVGTMLELEATSAWFYVYTMMPMFFSLSGFLVAGSALRLNIKNFLINRFCRIMPALVVQTFAVALIVGPWLTTLPLSEYFSNSLVYRYFANLFLWIQYKLPGLYATHPSQSMNQSIWSIPFEVICYAMVCTSMCFKNAQKHIGTIAFMVAALLLVPVLCQFAGMVNATGKTEYRLLNAAFFTRGSLLFPAFLTGTLFFWLRYRIPFSKPLFASCIALCVATSIFGADEWRASYLLNLFSVPVLAYIVAFIGCCRMPKVPFYSRGDYSYGIYIFGYALQQILLELFPSLLGQWFPHFVLSLAVTTVFAVFSWHCIERPILMKRKAYSMAATHIKA